MCQSEVAPQNMSADVGSVCTLMTDLSAVPRSEFTKLTTSKGVEYLNLDFSLDFIVDSASLMFELKVGGVSFFSLLERGRSDVRADNDLDRLRMGR